MRPVALLGGTAMRAPGISEPVPLPARTVECPPVPLSLPFPFRRPIRRPFGQQQRQCFDFASFALGRRTGPDRPGGFVGFCRPACSTSALDSREGHRSYLDAFAIGVLSGTPSTILVTAWGPSPGTEREHTP